VIFNDAILDLNIFTMEHLALPLADLFPLLKDPNTGKMLYDIASNFQTIGTAKNMGMIFPG
jgi:hypothetical protein